MLKKSNFICLCALVCSALLYSLPGMADDPVFDATVSNQIKDLQNSLDNRLEPELARQSQTLRSLDVTTQKGLTGSGIIGAYNNTRDQQNFRNWTPTSTDLANMVQQGLQTGSLADQIKYYNQKFPIPAPTIVNPNNPNSAIDNYGTFSATSTNTALSIADKGFDNAAQITQQLNYLYHQVDQEQTLKQGMDLNSTILLQIAALQTDLIRLQAQQLKMLGVSQQENNNKRLLASQFIQNVR